MSEDLAGLASGYELYCVAVETEVYVVATSREDAEDVAAGVSVLDLSDFDYVAQPAAPSSGHLAILKEMTDYLPWGDEGNPHELTVAGIAEWMAHRAKEAAAAAEFERRQLKLFPDLEE